MDYEKIKKLLIKNMGINEETMHVLSMGEYVKRITVKEFFEVIENSINTVNRSAYRKLVQQNEQSYCSCSRAKGIDNDKEGTPYCISCQKDVK